MRWITLMVLALLGVTPRAQEGVNVALVNVLQIQEQARPIRASIEAVEIEAASRQRHIALRESELEELYEGYQDQRSLLSEEARTQTERDIVDRDFELIELERDLREFLDESEAEVIRPVFDQIYQAIRTIAEENEIDLVLRSDAAVYASEDLNITEDVIFLLNMQARQASGESEAE